jgi:signal transduction histidine kinase
MGPEVLAEESGVLSLLIVDDDEVDRAAIKRALRGGGVAAEVEELDSAAHVSERLAARRFDCLILDHSLPGEDGLSLITRLRAAGSAVPILAVTGHEDDTGARLVAAGASDYMPKSDVSPERLSRRLRYAIRVGRAEAEARSAQRQLAGERSLLEALLRQTPVAMLVAERGSERIVMANEPVRTLLQRELASGDAVAIIESLDARRSSGKRLAAGEWPLVRALREGATITDEELVLERPSGEKVTVRASACPVVVDGQPIAAIMTMDDLTLERQTQEALARAVAGRDELVAVVSHDLRNPLSAVALAMEELGTHDLEPAARDRYAAAVRRALDRANRLISDLLEVSRIDAGKLTLEPTLLDVGAVIAQAARDHEILAQGAQVRIQVDLPPSQLWVRADRHRLLQALANLIGNALHHGRQGKLVELSLVQEAGGVVLSVADRGPGIPADALPHVFDRYWQGRRTRRGGAGLGLAIVKGIIDAHGGQLAVDNRPEGGARFTIRLPLAADKV